MISICDIISMLSSISGDEQADSVRVGPVSEAGAVAGDEDDGQPQPEVDGYDHQGRRC